MRRRYEADYGVGCATVLMLVCVFGAIFIFLYKAVVG